MDLHSTKDDFVRMTSDILALPRQRRAQCPAVVAGAYAYWR